MHATTISYVFLLLSPFTQSGDYSGGYAQPDATGEGPRFTVTDSTRSRSTRGANALDGQYPAARVATNPRYADEANRDPTGMPPVNDSANQHLPEDPQSILAAKLLREMIHVTNNEQNVQTVHLYDSLARTAGSQQQFEAIKAYWDWNLSVAELHGVLEEEALLGRVVAPRTVHEEAAHQASRHAAAARKEDSMLEVALRLMDLQTVTGIQPRGTPRPADIPFVSNYNTNFQRLFPSGSAPAALRKINYTLPYILKVVRTRADAVAASRLALGKAETAYQGGQMPHADLLESIALVRSQRRAFLDAVHDYNFAIAEYALTAAGPGQQRETVVSMLIRTNATAGQPYRGASYSPYDVRPVSNEEPLYNQPWQTNYVPRDGK